MNSNGHARTLRVSVLVLTVLGMAGCSESGGGGGGGDGGGDRGGDGGITLIDPLPQARGLLPNLATADFAFESDHYSGSEICESCHSNAKTASDEPSGMVVFEDAGVRDVSIGTAWETSTMANSTRDPYWHAVYATELDNYPELDHEINDTCTRCHAPMASDLAKKEGLALQLFDSGSAETGDFVQGLYSMDADDPLYNHGMDGVSCTLCHQIADDGNLGSKASMTGGWKVLQYAERGDRPAYGQYEDVDVGYMRQQANFSPLYGAHTSTSETCATCHNLFSNSVDTHGVEVPGPNSFPEQAMFTEWQSSDYAIGGSEEASCQSCHMPKVDQTVPLVRDGEIKRNNFAEHSFLAANTVMQDMMHNYREELGIPTDVDFQPAIERNRKFLATAADLEIEAGSVSADTLEFDVQVTNRTGHKLPSGYHSRRVYLHVVVTDAEGGVVFESGRMDAAGRISGNSEDTNPMSHELHYDVITDPSQVQVYQAIMENSDGDRTHSLLNGFAYSKDNRLTPAGFNKNAVPDDVKVTGMAATDPDFNLGADTVTYRVAVDGEATYNVRAELRYQPLAYGHLAVLFARSERLDAVDRFRTIYDNTTLRDESIATATVEIR